MHPSYLLRRTASLVLFIIFLLIASQYAWAEEPAGRLMFVHGQVWVERNGEGSAAHRGDSVFAGDTIITEAASSAQIRFTDGGTNALRPNTRFTLHEYINDAENPKNSRKTSELARGGLRSISGAISRVAPENVSYNTPVATMGIRGTTFVIVHNEQGTHLRVEFGAVSMQSEVGTRIARQGQAFRVGLRNQLPVQIPPDSKVFEEAEQQQQQGQATGAGSTSVQGGSNDRTPPPPPGGSDNTAPQASGEFNNQRTVQQPDSSENIENPLFPDIPDTDDSIINEQACQAQGFANCTARDAFLAAEQACQAQGFANCAARDAFLAAEQACQAQGFANCAARDAFLAAEQACQAQGFDSCTDRDAFLAAEQACQAQGFANCAARDAHLAAELACQAQGFPTCADMQESLSGELAREANCVNLGFSSCNQMLSGSQYTTTPLNASGRTQVMIGGNTYLLPRNQTQWLTHSGTAVLGGFNNPTQVRVQTLNNTTPISGGSLTAITPGGTSYYWGVWSKNNFRILNPTTLEPLGTTPADLHYIAASQMFGGNVLNTLEEISFGDTIYFSPVGGTALTGMSTSNNKLIQVEEHSGLVFNSYNADFNVMIALYYQDSATGPYFELGGYGISLAELLSTSGASLVLIEDVPTPAPVGSGTLRLNFTGGSTIDGAISQLRVNFANEGVQAYGNLIWQLDDPHQPCPDCFPMPVSCDGPSCRGFTSLESQVSTMFDRFYEDGGATFVHTGGWTVTRYSELQPATVIRNAINVPVADVYWGYWGYGEYNVRDATSQPYDLLGDFHYIFSEDSFNGSVDISSATQIVFNLLQNSPLSSYAPGSLSLTDGSLTMENSGVTAELTFLNGVNTEILTGSLNGLPSLTSLPEITLIPGSTPMPGEISSATIEGFFVGSQAEGIASWITVDRDGDPFKGTAVFQRDY